MHHLLHLPRLSGKYQYRNRRKRGDSAGNGLRRLGQTAQSVHARVIRKRTGIIPGARFHSTRTPAAVRLDKYECKAVRPADRQVFKS